MPSHRCIFLSIALILCSALPALALDLREVTFVTKSAGKVAFSHNRHMKQEGIAGNCKSCHSAIFPMKREPKTMAQMERGQSCGACHNGKKAFPLASCARCHQVREVVIPVAATGPVRFSHQRHLKSDANCASCHDSLFKAARNRPVGMAAMAKGQSCGACHNGSKAFALARCTGCHPVRDVRFKIKETGDLTFSHKSHISRNGCGDCHTKLFSTGNNRRYTMKQMEKGASCGACHNGTKAFAVADCGGCHPVKDRVFRVKETGPLTFRHRKHLASISCQECHGKIYPVGTKSHASMKQMERGKSCGACHNGSKAFALNQCSGCHPVRNVKFAVKLSPTLSGTATFSHKTHLAKYDCSACHTKTFPAGRGNRFSMGEMEQGRSCGACHDATVAFSVKENCGKCHLM